MIRGILENPRNSDFVLSNPRVTSFRNLGLHPLLGVQFPDTNLGMGVTEVGQCPGNKGTGDRVAVWHQPSTGGRRWRNWVGCDGRCFPEKPPAELAASLRASRIASCPPSSLPSWLGPRSRWQSTTVTLFAWRALCTSRRGL